MIQLAVLGAISQNHSNFAASDISLNSQHYACSIAASSDPAIASISSLRMIAPPPTFANTHKNHNIRVTIPLCDAPISIKKIMVDAPDALSLHVVVPLINGSTQEHFWTLHRSIDPQACTWKLDQTSGSLIIRLVKQYTRHTWTCIGEASTPPKIEAAVETQQVKKVERKARRSHVTSMTFYNGSVQLH
jgi:hypothetical protein